MIKSIGICIVFGMNNGIRITEVINNFDIVFKTTTTFFLDENLSRNNPEKITMLPLILEISGIYPINSSDVPK